MKLRGRIFYVFLILAVQHIEPLIVRGMIVRKKRDDGSYCYIYGIYDLHLSNLMGDSALRVKIDAKNLLTIARNQYASLVSSIKKSESQDRIVLVEDSYTYRDGHGVIPSGLQNILKVYGQGTNDILFEISQRLQNDNIQSLNIDFRQKRIAAGLYDSFMVQIALNIDMLKKIAAISDPLIKSFNRLTEFQINMMQNDGLTGENLLKYEPVLNYTMGDISKDLDAEINKILKYEDGTELYHYYRNQIRLIRKQGSVLYQKMQEKKDQKYRSFAVSLGEKVSMFSPSFAAYAGALLDMNGLHEIVQNQSNKKKILLVAGAAHVNKIFLKLLNLGYEPVYECGLSNENINGVTKPLEEMYDINAFFTLNVDDLAKKMHDSYSKVKPVALSVVEQKNNVPQRFFDLIAAGDPERALMDI